VHFGLELIGNPLTRDGTVLVRVRVGSSFPLNGVLILLDEGVSSARSPVRAKPSATISSVMLTTLTIALPGSGPARRLENASLRVQSANAEKIASRRP
jgi:hypothetical protein